VRADLDLAAPSDAAQSNVQGDIAVSAPTAKKGLRMFVFHRTGVVLMLACCS
jgi:hypothetical protein